MASKIEDMINELQDYVDRCKNAPFKTDSIVVNRDDLESYIEDLRATVPDEIRQYQRIINNQEHIIAAARKKADAIIKEAEIQTDQLVSEHQIMQQAYARANEVVLVASKEAEQILNKATLEANDIKEGAIAYTDNQLKIVQDIMTATMEQTRQKADGYLNQMQGYLDIVVSNRNELAPPEADTVIAEQVAQVPYSEDVAVESINTDDNTNDNTNSQSDEGDNSKGIDVPDVFFNQE